MAMTQPQEIDTQLADIYAPLSGAITAMEQTQKTLKLSYVKRNPERCAELQKTITAAQEAIAALDAQAEPLEAIYLADPWTRFFLVPGGHLHSSRRCSSFRWNTRFYWLPEYSGKTEAAEKAVKRKATAAAAITVGKTIYKTQRAAENQIGWEIDTMISRRYQVAANPEHRAQLDNNAAANERAAVAIAHALFVQIPGYDPDAILAKKFAAKLKTYKGYDHYDIPVGATF